MKRIFASALVPLALRLAARFAEARSPGANYLPKWHACVRLLHSELHALFRRTFAMKVDFDNDERHDEVINRQPDL
jgi:hypothetical protein